MFGGPPLNLKTVNISGYTASVSITTMYIVNELQTSPQNWLVPIATSSQQDHAIHVVYTWDIKKPFWLSRRCPVGAQFPGKLGTVKHREPLERLVIMETKKRGL